MLKKIRQIVAVLSLLTVTALFVDFTGVAREWFGWMASIQFLPALLSLNLTVLIGLVVLTLVFGRIYCSVICPLGIMQDGFAWLGKKGKKNRYSWSAPKNILRYGFLLLMIVVAILGINSIFVLLAPYSAYGRIAHAFVSPIVIWINNIFAGWAESNDSYAFARVDFWLRSFSVAGVAAITLLVLGFLSWRNGRTYCNTVCPVGTVLGFLSRFSVLRPVVDSSKCNSCGLCARNCKSSCIDSRNKKIDYSRCVTCFDCVEKCNKGAISYTWRREDKISLTDEDTDTMDEQRRAFLTITGMVATTAALKAEKTVDGGLATILDKSVPKRRTKIVPPGAVSISNLESHCTACQLCVSACPNEVLRPSTELDSWMQPESSYERGYCRPECTACSDICPTGAIKPLTVAEKSSVQVGHAVINRNSCIARQGKDNCGNCARHCPTGAITMVEHHGKTDRPKVPVVNIEKCIGCGACENLCPVRPDSAIYVEGHEAHRVI